MEPENTPPDKGKTSSKPSFSGSMLIFEGVDPEHQMNRKVIFQKD